jgi:hypothetical protein
VCMDGRGFVGRHLQAAEHGGHEVVNRLGVEASMENTGRARVVGVGSRVRWA